MTEDQEYPPPGTPPPHQVSAARLRTLETQVRTLAQAVRALAESLEEPPDRQPDRARTARAAHLAHDLLLAQGL